MSAALPKRGVGNAGVESELYGAAAQLAAKSESEVAVHSENGDIKEQMAPSLCGGGAA